ncbi:MAG: DUF1508 domain-containing protein [Anaerolineae bacterium]|nr:DUF1508 domain-containing protein [Anaerolineae bacterium]
MKTTICVYRGVNGWRWRMYSTRGTIIGASSEAYKRRIDCIRNLERVTGLAVSPADLDAEGCLVVNLGDRVLL